MRPPVQGCVLKFIHVPCLSQELTMDIKFTVVIKCEILILSSLVIVNTDCIHSFSLFSSLSYDRSKASSKSSSQQRAI